MNKIFYRINIVITLALFFLYSNYANGQCTNCGNNYPIGTDTTTSATWSDITTCNYGSEWANCNLDASYIYQWKTPANPSWDTQLTLYPSGTCGVTDTWNPGPYSLAYNDDYDYTNFGRMSLMAYNGSVTSVRYLISLYPCTSNLTCMATSWRAIPKTPTISGGGVTVCSGASVTLTASNIGNNDGFVNVEWGTSSGGIELSSDATSINVSPTTTTTYYLRYAVHNNYPYTFLYSNVASTTITVVAEPSTPAAFSTSWSGDHYVNTSFTTTVPTTAGATYYRLCMSLDNSSGCSTWVNGDATYSAGQTVTVSGTDLPSAGTFRYYMWYAYNSCDVQSAAGGQDYVRMDGQAPTTPSAFSTSWTADHYVCGNFNTTVPSNSTDAGIGGIYYSLCRSTDNSGGCNTWVNGGTTYSAGATVTVSGADLPSVGAYRYYMWYSFDAFGNQSAVGTQDYVRNPSTFSAGSISGGNGTICSGSAAGTFTAAPSGGSGSNTIDWYYEDGVTAPSSGGGTYSGTSGTSYIPGALTITRTYQAYITSAGSCGAGWTSNAITITVDAISNAGSVTQNPLTGGTVCSGSNVSYTQSGGTGTFNYFEYQWNGTGGSWSGSWETTNPYNWTSGLNGASILYVRAVKTNGVCPAAVSAPVSITVQSTDNNPGAISVPASICAGTATNISNVTVATTGSPSSTGPTYYYYWSRTSAPATGYTNYATSSNSSYALPSDVINTPGTYLLARNSSFSCTGQANNFTTVNIPLTVNSNITPTFDAVAPICDGGSLSPLPTISNNGITGTWAPALDNTQTTIYTFTPDAGQCATTTTLTITVNSNITPTFDAVAPICDGESLSALPTISNNGITGTWAPALDNTQTTIYTFTPDAGLCATTTTLTITVNPTITFVSITTNQTICEESNFNLEIAVTGGVNPLSYQWQSSSDDSNWDDILGVQSSIYTISNLASNTYFRCNVSSIGLGCATLVSPSTFIQTAELISITNQPEGKSICTSGSATMSVTATGGIGLLQYQWQTSDDNISWNDILGETNSNLSVSSLSAGIHYYKCIVIDSDVNACPSLTSDTAIITVVNSPSAIINPISETVCDNGYMHLSLAIESGFIATSYQWQNSIDSTNWIDISGATINSYDTPNLSLNTWYRVILTWDPEHGCNESTSDNAKIYVVPDASISHQPQPYTTNYCVGTIDEINVVIDGGSYITYQWQSSDDGLLWNNILGETLDTLQIPTATPDTLFFRCQINIGGAGCTPVLISDSVMRIIDNPIEITQQPSNDSICEGGSATLNIEHGNGNGNTISYTWEKSPNGIDTWSNVGDNQSYTTPLLLENHFYRCTLSQTGNTCGDAVSDIVEITVVGNPLITTQPTAEDSVCQNQSQAIFVEITGGAGNITYQWQSSDISGGPFTNIDTATNQQFFPPSNIPRISYYRCIINIDGSGCASPLTSDETKYTVVSQFFISTQAENDSLCQGNSSTLHIELSGGNGSDFNYQWQSSTNMIDWTNVGDNNDTLITDILFVTTYYRVNISQENSICNSVTSDIATITLFADISIEAQTNSPSYTCENNEIFLAVMTNGGGNLTYQWQTSDTFDGTYTNVTQGSGANSAMYFPPVDTPYDAWFKCIINSSTTGCTSSIESDTIHLYVLTDFNIDEQPIGATICQGGNHTMNVSITGGTIGETYSYQWLESTDGLNYSIIPGEVLYTYTASGLAQTTWYKVVAYQSASLASCGYDTSSVAQIIVVPDPTITDQTVSPISICQNNGQDLSITVDGGVTVDYQWQISNSSGGIYTNVILGIGGQTNTYTPPSDVAGTFWYKCVVNITGEGCNPGILESNEMEYIVSPDYNFTTQPTDAIICIDGNINLSVVVSAGNGQTIHYQWQESDDNINFTDIIGATSNNYDALGNDGSKYYHCIVNQEQNVCGTKISNSAFIDVRPLINIYIQPDSATIVCEGANAEISIAVSGGYNNTFQWQESDDNIIFTDILGANSNSLTPPLMLVGTKKFYRCVVSSSAVSGCDDVISDTAIYQVISAPIITNHPADSEICVGENVDLSITATSGGGILTYQWQVATDNCSGTFTDITGANSADYQATNILQTSYFRCVVGIEGATCSVTSNCGTVSLFEIPNFVQQPLSSTICLGASYNMQAIVSGGLNISYQWQISSGDCSGVWSDILDSTSTSLTVTPSVTSYYRVKINYGSGNCELYSNCVTISMGTQSPVPTVLRVPDVPEVCLFANLTVDVSGCIENTYMQYKKPNTSIWLDDDLAFAPEEVGTAYFRVRCESSGNCPSDWVEVSWNVVLTAPAPTITKTPNVNDICVNTNVSSTIASGSTAWMGWNVSPDGGITWNNYTPENQTNTPNPGNEELQIRAKRLFNPESACGETDWSFVKWNTFDQPIAPELTPNPNQAGVCLNADVSATFNIGSGGIIGSDEISYSTDAGTTWTNYPSGLQLTANTSGNQQIEIQSMRISSGYGCVNDTNKVIWDVYDLPQLTNYNLGCPTYDYAKVELLPTSNSGIISIYNEHIPSIQSQATSILTIPFPLIGHDDVTAKFTVTDNHACISDTLSVVTRRPWGYSTTSALGTCYMLGNDQWAYVTRNDYSVLIGINDGNQNLGLTVANVFVDDNTSIFNQTWYLKRHYVINTVTEPIAPVQVRLFFTADEFSNLESLSTTNINTYDDVFSMGDLKVTKYHGINIDDSYANNDFNTSSNFNVLTPNINGDDNLFSSGNVLKYIDVTVSSFSEFWIHGGSSGSSWLPVELLSFDGVCNNQIVMLKWITSSETNNEFFSIENSSDGINFNEIGRVNGAGNSNNLNIYEFAIPSNDNSNYYRLTQTDFNGKMKSFDPIVVKCADEDQIQVYPNPFTSSITIKGNISEPIKLEVFSSIQKVAESEISFDGTYDYLLDYLKPGTYILRITSNNETYYYKIVKL